MFNLFRLLTLENETMEMFRMRERSKSKHKSVGTKVWEAIREYHINLKIENEVFV